MKNNKQLKSLLALSIASAVYANVAVAAGPLFLHEPGVPFKYDVSATVPVYTDQGALCMANPPWWLRVGCLTNEQADEVTAKAWAEWNNVETSNFKAQIAGELAQDITGANAGSIIGTDNGGGIHVMYDSDSSIITNFFGAPSGVLGIASPEWADENGIISESWAVLNVAAVPKSYKPTPEEQAAESAAHALGVFTHEFGHTINLSHSQVNGNKVMYRRDIVPNGSCAAPYDYSDYPDGYSWDKYVENLGRIETMFPFINPSITGDVQGTVDITDDKVAISNIYPAAGYKENNGSISGKITLKDGTTELTGVNVVARNIANPYWDAVSVMSGDQTQGQVGPDGSYTINGLTPGAEYVVYVEGILAGGYPTPAATLPAMQEYYNGNGESGNASQDDPCAWTTIKAVAGQTEDASIAFNGIARAPKYIALAAPYATSVSQNGKTVAGSASTGVSWIWDEKDGYKVNSSGSAHISSNARKFVGTKYMEVAPWNGGLNKPGYWDEQTGWSFIPMPDADSCDGSLISTWGASDSADVIVGLGYVDGCPSWSSDEVGFSAVRWDAKKADQGWEYLQTPDMLFVGEPAGERCTWDSNNISEEHPWGWYIDGCKVSGSRANAVSGDGDTTVGHVDAGGWKGSAWVDGKFQIIGADTEKGWVGSANGVNADGTAVTGGLAGGTVNGGWSEAYVWSPETGTKLIGSMECPPFAWGCWSGRMDGNGIAISDDGKTVLGRAGNFFVGFKPFIWRENLGMRDLNEFMQHQGIMEAFSTNLIFPSAISGDGKTFVGTGVSPTGIISYVIKLDQVWLCHRGKSSLAGYPGGMDSHIEHGDEVGLCEADRPISPN